MRKIRIIDLISDTILGLGLIIIVSPVFLFWFIHGDYERYKWLISGPYPFNSFGGGPFQLFMGIGLLLIGFLLIAVSLATKKYIR